MHSRGVRAFEIASNGVANAMGRGFSEVRIIRIGLFSGRGGAGGVWVRYCARSVGGIHSRAFGISDEADCSNLDWGGLDYGVLYFAALCVSG